MDTKIIFFSHDAGLYGGAQRMLLEYLQFTHPESERRIVVFPREGPMAAQVRKLSSHVVRVIERPGRRRSLTVRFVERTVYLLRLVGFLLRERPDLVYVSTLAHTSPLLAAWLSRVPALLNVMESRSFFAGGLTVRLRTELIRRVPFRVIAVARAVANVLVEHGVAEAKIVVVHCGIPVTLYPASVEQRVRQRTGLALNEHVTLVGMVGQVNRRKGTEVFLRAAHIVRERVGASVFFVIVGGKGDDDYWNQMQELARALGLEQSVSFAGYQDDIAPWLAAMDVFVSASLEEPFARIILEAMASGLPVIASDVDGTSEAVVDGVTGSLFPSGDYVALARHVIDFVGDADRRLKAGAAGRHVVETSFTSERYCAKISSLIRDGSDSTPQSAQHFTSRPG